MPTIILFIIVLFLVVVVHEAGHFFAAKQMGMRIKEFAFGFPPRLISWTRKETKYSINALPLGGYVAIDGENGKTDAEIAQDSKLFTAKSRLAQAWVMFAGPFMNIVLAFVLLSISYMTGYGNASSGNSLVVLNVLPNSPAEIAGIKAGDKIYSVYTDSSTGPAYSPNIEIFKEVINNSNGKNITVEVERSKEISSIEFLPNKENSEYKIGVSLGQLENKKLGFFSSIVQGFKDSMKMTWDTISGFGKIIGSIFGAGDIKASLTGPVGIAKEVGTASSFGFAYLLSFIALISVNLGVLNMFPFPALDGGRLLFLLIEKIKGSRINPRVANIVNSVGFGLLLLLMVVITVKDVIKLF